MGREFPGVQWSGLLAVTDECIVSIFGWETKIPQAMRGKIKCDGEI